MLLSLLTPTLASRADKLRSLQEQLQRQIRLHHLVAEVEHLTLCDQGEQTVGAKRNELLQRARGEFVAHVDDDDTLADDYLKRICETLHENPAVDCIGFVGIIYFRGQHPARFINSLRYRHFGAGDGGYVRPPNHLNPIRRSIALRYPFAEVSYSEDIDFSLRMVRDNALRSEVFLEEPLYFYKSRRHWPYQWLLDKTEPLRHALGLVAVNRLRVYPDRKLAREKP